MTPEQEVDFYGKDAAEQVRRWDAGENIWTISMGGLGPGYEQCIQIMAVEFTRAGKDMPRTEDEKADWKSFDAICTAALKPIDESLGGVTGAQYGVAKNLAWRWCFHGGPIDAVREMKKIDENRIMMASKHFPRAP